MKRLPALLALPLAACQPAPSPPAAAPESSQGRFQVVGMHTYSGNVEVYVLDTKSGVVCFTGSPRTGGVMTQPICSPPPSTPAP